MLQKLRAGCLSVVLYVLSTAIANATIIQVQADGDPSCVSNQCSVDLVSPGAVTVNGGDTIIFDIDLTGNKAIQLGTVDAFEFNFSGSLGSGTASISLWDSLALTDENGVVIADTGPITPPVLITFDASQFQQIIIPRDLGLLSALDNTLFHDVRFQIGSPVGSPQFNLGLTRVAFTGTSGRVVPEPTTLALLSLGLVGLGVARKKKKT